MSALRDYAEARALLDLLSERDPADSASQRERRRDAAREARARLLPRDRVCPECHRVVAAPIRWVVPREGRARCRSCHHRVVPSRALARAIVARREALNMTASELARRCEWSRSHQSRIESATRVPDIDRLTGALGPVSCWRERETTDDRNDTGRA